MKWIISKDGSDILTIEGDVVIREDVPVPPTPPVPPVPPVPPEPPSPTPGAPLITLTPPSGAYGTMVTIQGSGFAKNDFLFISAVAGGTDFSTKWTSVVCNDNGTFSLPQQVPPMWWNTVYSSYTISATRAGTTVSASATFEVAT